MKHHRQTAAHREVIAVARGATPTHTHLRRRLLIIAGATVVASIVFTLVVYFTEHSAKGTEIHDLLDAFLFSTSQLLTASSVAAPRTDFGKVLELFFDIWAITVVAAAAGSFGAFFHARSKEINGEIGREGHKLELEGRELRGRLGGSA